MSADPSRGKRLVATPAPSNKGRGALALRVSPKEGDASHDLASQSPRRFIFETRIKSLLILPACEGNVLRITETFSDHAGHSPGSRLQGLPLRTHLQAGHTVGD